LEVFIAELSFLAGRFEKSIAENRKPQSTLKVTGKQVRCQVREWQNGAFFALQDRTVTRGSRAPMAFSTLAEALACLLAQYWRDIRVCRSCFAATKNLKQRA
jgi:hypothetical protein